MSKLVLYDIPPAKYSGLNELIKFLPQNIQNTYYQYRLCCHQLNLELPLELWCEIIYLFCGVRSNPVPDNKILEWYDQYIRDKRQHELNPIFMNTSDSFNIAGFYNDIDVSYDLRTIPLNGHGNRYNVHVPRLGNLMVGIVQDDKIKSITFTMGGGYPFKYNVSELYGYALDCVYSHSINNILEMQASLITPFSFKMELLLDPKYENKQKLKFWSAPDIMPFSIINAPYHDMFIELETTEQMTNITLLYAYLPINIRNNMVKDPLSYRKIKYCGGMVYLNE